MLLEFIVAAAAATAFTVDYKQNCSPKNSKVLLSYLKKKIICNTIAHVLFPICLHDPTCYWQLLTNITNTQNKSNSLHSWALMPFLLKKISKKKNKNKLSVLPLSVFVECFCLFLIPIFFYFKKGIVAILCVASSCSCRI